MGWFLVLCTLAYGAEPSRIRRYSPELGRLRPHRPYLARFEKNGKEVVYIAAAHVSQCAEMLTHPTMKTIREAFAESHPDVVVVEGLRTGEELSPQSVMGQADECKRSHYEKCSETFYAINLARENNAHFISGEPSDDAILRHVASMGYTANDLIGYYLLRQIPQLRRMGKWDAKGFPGTVKGLVSYYEKQMKTKVTFGFSDFEVWCQNHIPKPANYEATTNTDVAPIQGAGSTFIQRLASEVSYFRDLTIVERIFSMLDRFSTVMVVYGADHLTSQEPEIEFQMGKAVYFPRGIY